MDTAKQDSLLYEAKMQTKMIGNLAKWARNAMALSTIGIVLAWWGLSGSGARFAAGIAGMVLTVFSVAAAVIVNLAVRNGRKNVEKLLSAAGK